MKILLLEYFTAMPSGPVDPALRAEGGAMRDAVALDLARLPGVSVTVLHRPGLEPPSARGVRGLPVTRALDRSLSTHAASCDATLLIAPEQGGTLARLSRLVLGAGCRLLGPGPAAVRLAADKLRTARLLRRHGIPTPPTSALRLDRRTARRLLERPLPLVLKPRDGCGCQGVSRVARAAEIAPALRRLRRATGRRQALAQGSVPGVDASVSLIAFRDGILPLALGRQRVDKRGAFAYRGGRMPYRHQSARRAIDLAVRAAGALAEASGDLSGFLGVDLVLGRQGPVVIEINPRLTTSYIGLREIIGTNLGSLILSAGWGGARPPGPRLLGWCEFEAGGGRRVRRVTVAPGGAAQCGPIAAGISAASI